MEGTSHPRNSGQENGEACTPQAWKVLYHIWALLLNNKHHSIRLGWALQRHKRVVIRTSM